jgi:hypothetical protein
MAKGPVSEDGTTQDPGPSALKLLADYVHVDASGNLREWKAGEVVTDPADVAYFTETGALVELV